MCTVPKSDAHLVALEPREVLLRQVLHLELQLTIHPGIPREVFNHLTTSDVRSLRGSATQPRIYATREWKRRREQPLGMAGEPQ